MKKKKKRAHEYIEYQKTFKVAINSHKKTILKLLLVQIGAHFVCYVFKDVLLLYRNLTGRSVFPYGFNIYTVVKIKQMTVISHLHYEKTLA